MVTNLEDLCKELFENHANLAKYSIEQLLAFEAQDDVYLGKNLKAALKDVIHVQLTMLAEEALPSSLYDMFITEQSLYKNFQTAFLQEFPNNPRLRDIQGFTEDQISMEKNGHLYKTLKSKDWKSFPAPFLKPGRQINQMYFYNHTKEMLNIPEDIVLQKAHMQRKFIKSWRGDDECNVGFLCFLSPSTTTTYTVDYTLNHEANRFELNENLNFASEKPTLDANEYKINGRTIKSEADIDASLWQRPITEIEALMKTPNSFYSLLGFLGKKDVLLDVVKEDFQKLQKLGLTNAQLSAFLKYFNQQYALNKTRCMFLGKEHHIHNDFAFDRSLISLMEEGACTPWAHAVSNGICSPFEDKNIGGLDLVLYNNPDNCSTDSIGTLIMPKEGKFGFSTTLIHLIEQHGFFERGPYHFNIDKFIKYFVKPCHVPVYQDVPPVYSVAKVEQASQPIKSDEASNEAAKIEPTSQPIKIDEASKENKGNSFQFWTKLHSSAQLTEPLQQKSVSNYSLE